jgi:hypothetical protein
MRPVIKKKRIDPRYFLNETVNRKELEEIFPLPSPDKKEGAEKGDEDTEDAEDAEGCAPVNIVKKSKDSKKVAKGKKGDKDKKGKGKDKEKKVLFGEEELRAMVKEVIEELEEGVILQEWDWWKRKAPEFLGGAPSWQADYLPGGDKHGVYDGVPSEKLTQDQVESIEASQPQEGWLTKLRDDALGRSQRNE